MAQPSTGSNTSAMSSTTHSRDPYCDFVEEVGEVTAIETLMRR